MKARFLVSYILSIIIIILFLSSVTQAIEYREVKAEEILKQIYNREDVNYTNCRIVGELNASNIALKTVPNPQYYELAEFGYFSEEELEYYNINESLKVIESNITIKNSVFEDNLYFSNVLFNGSADFSGASFNNNADFNNANFNSDPNLTITNFTKTSFYGNADFDNVDFNNMVTFSRVDFNNSVNFHWASFNDYADFDNASFNNFANFEGVSFDSPAWFEGANFNSSANFEFASFYSDVNFMGADFNGDADFLGAEFFTEHLDGVNVRHTSFSNANFNSSADFSNVHFDSSASFGGSNFNSSANFFLTNFNSYTDFMDVNFNSDADFSNDLFYSDTHLEGANFNGDASFLATNFSSNVYFSGTKFNGSADFRDTDFNNLADLTGPETPDNVIIDGESCEAFRKAYESETRYGDADTVYYNYRKLCQDDKDLMSLSKWSDFIGWATCGYGLKPLRIFWPGAVIVGIFACLYWLRSGIYKSSDADTKKSEVSFWDGLYFSINTFTTLGSADWYPRDNFRKWVTLEGLCGWIFLGIFMATLANILIR